MKTVNSQLDGTLDSVPSQGIGGPNPRSTMVQLQQTKIAGISPKASTAVPVSPATVSPATQGQPKTLSSVQIVKTSISDTQNQLTISFVRDPTDNFYTHAVVHLTTGNNQPIQIGAGVESPLKIAVTKTNAPSTIHVQACGNWGSTPVSSCPVKTISLA
jgi:hypothetical protein